MEIRIAPKKTTYLFLSIVVVLTLIHCLALVFFFHFDYPGINTISEWFDLDIERNIPSFYSSVAILACSILFLVITGLEKEATSYIRCCWLGLAVVFLFLSLDEGFEIHETIGDVTENHINATGLLYFPWVLPYSFLVVVFGLIYLKFILLLPAKTAKLFVLSGSGYLTGAVFFDMLGGREAEENGFYSAAYSTFYTIEEFLEMVAIVVLIYALLDYLERRFGWICISLRVKYP